MAESRFSGMEQILFLNIDSCTALCGVIWDACPFLNVSLIFLVKIILKIEVSREKERMYIKQYKCTKREKIRHFTEFILR